MQAGVTYLEIRMNRDEFVQKIWEELLEHDQDMIAIDPFDFALGYCLGGGLADLDEIHEARFEIAEEVRTLWDAAKRLDGPPPQNRASEAMRAAMEAVTFNASDIKITYNSEAIVDGHHRVRTLAALEAEGLIE